MCVNLYPFEETAARRGATEDGDRGAGRGGRERADRADRGQVRAGTRTSPGEPGLLARELDCGCISEILALTRDRLFARADLTLAVTSPPQWPARSTEN